MNDETHCIVFDVNDTRWATWKMFEADVLLLLSKELDKAGFDVGYIHVGAGVVYTYCTIDAVRLSIEVFVPHAKGEEEYQSAVICSPCISRPFWMRLFGLTGGDSPDFQEPLKQLANKVKDSLEKDPRIGNVKSATIGEWVKLRGQRN